MHQGEGLERPWQPGTASSFLSGQQHPLSSISATTTRWARQPLSLEAGLGQQSQTLLSALRPRGIQILRHKEALLLHTEANTRHSTGAKVRSRLAGDTKTLCTTEMEGMQYLQALGFPGHGLYQPQQLDTDEKGRYHRGLCTWPSQGKEGETETSETSMVLKESSQDKAWRHMSENPAT